VCNYVGSGDNRMTWEQIHSLHDEGHDLASHTTNHDDLSKLPPQTVEYEVAQSKQCLFDQGINPKFLETYIIGKLEKSSLWSISQSVHIHVAVRSKTHESPSNITTCECA
jgi:hypothetical protein